MHLKKGKKNREKQWGHEHGAAETPIKAQGCEVKMQ